MKKIIISFATILLFFFLAILVNEESLKKNSTVILNSDNYAYKIEIINPIKINSFDNEGNCESIKVLSEVRNEGRFTVLKGISDNDAQIDPQIAVGGGYVVQATNSGILLFSKKGEFIKGIRQECWQGGIDPKLFFDPHNNLFGLALWHYYDKPQKKPINFTISSSSEPKRHWNTYSVSAIDAYDGGSIGYSSKWVGYSYSSGDEGKEGRTLLFSTANAKVGKPTNVYHFNKNLGQPAYTQDFIEDIYFLEVTEDKFILNKITTDKNNQPNYKQVWSVLHHLTYVDYPPEVSQKGTNTKVASGDRNPKNLVIQSGYLWFAQTINFRNQSAIQWHQVSLKNGEIIQTGLIYKNDSNFIHGTIAVNKNNDVLIGFQECNEDMYVSPRFAIHMSTDVKGKTQIVNIEEGTAPYSLQNEESLPWGDYSGSIIDGDNLIDLWTTQNIMQSNHIVGSRIVKFKY